MTAPRPYAAFLRGALLFLMLGGVRPEPAPAQVDMAKEAEFKAAYLYNFLQFIEWPAAAFPDSGSPIVVGVLNQDALAGSLERIVQGEYIGKRRIVVRRLTSVAEIGGCHVFYVPRTESRSVWRSLSAVDGLQVLTVGEADGFAEEGGGINFFIQDNKLRFEINPQALKKSNLTASSKLLRLAKIVETPGRW